jgi:hypothetical protein
MDSKKVRDKREKPKREKKEKENKVKRKNPFPNGSNGF